jgi:hypothetical protein
MCQSTYRDNSSMYLRSLKRFSVSLPAALLCIVLLAALPLRPAMSRERPEVKPDLPATSNDFRFVRTQNSPLLAADPTDSRFVVLAHRLDAPDFSCALQISGDGGRTFVEATPMPELPKNAEKCYAPEVAFDQEGRLYYLFIGLRGAGNSPMGVFLTTSSDRAKTFTKPVRVLGAGNYQVRMAMDPTAGDRGRLHLVWLHTTEDAPTGGLPLPPNPIMTKHSDDGGQTFSEPLQISDPQRRLSVAPSVALAPDGTVHVVYYDFVDDMRDYQGLEGPTWPGKWALIVTSSTDAGENFSRGVVVDDGVVPPERVLLIFTMPPPALAAGSDGSLYVAWHDGRNEDWDVFLSGSSDGGRSWNNPMRLNDDDAGNGVHQYLPRVAVAPGGRVDVIFYDRRDDPDNVDNDVYYTFSTNGGESFSENLRLTTESSDSRSGQHYLVPSAQDRADFGSRIALLAREDRAIAAWTDTRNALLAPYQDIFSTQIVFDRDATATGSSTTPIILPIMVGVLLLALLGFVGIRSMRRRSSSGASEHDPAGVTEEL